MSKVIVNFAALPFSEKEYQPQFANIGIAEELPPNELGYEESNFIKFSISYHKDESSYFFNNEVIKQSNEDMQFLEISKKASTFLQENIQQLLGKNVYSFSAWISKHGVDLEKVKSYIRNLFLIQKDYLRIQSLYELATVKEQDSIEVKNFAQLIMQLASETTLCPPNYSWQLLLPDSINNKLTLHPFSRDYKQIKADLEERNIIIKSFPSQDSTCLLVHGNGLIRKHSKVEYIIPDDPAMHWGNGQKCYPHCCIDFLPDQYTVHEDYKASSVVLAFDLTFSDQ